MTQLFKREIIALRHLPISPPLLSDLGHSVPQFIYQQYSNANDICLLSSHLTNNKSGCWDIL